MCKYIPISEASSRFGIKINTLRHAAKRGYIQYIRSGWEHQLRLNEVRVYASHPPNRHWGAQKWRAVYLDGRDPGEIASARDGNKVSPAEVVRLREEGHTYQEIADIYGVSRQRIHHLIKERT